MNYLVKGSTSNKERQPIKCQSIKNIYEDYEGYNVEKIKTIYRVIIFYSFSSKIHKYQSQTILKNCKEAPSP